MSAPGGAGGWVRVCHLAALGEDQPVHADVGQWPVCLVRTGGAVYAVRDECTHQSVPLSDGEVADGAIECWLHGSRFDLATGQVLSPPATRPVTVFGVRTDGEDVFVHLGRRADHHPLAGRPAGRPNCRVTGHHGRSGGPSGGQAGPPPASEATFSQA